MIILLPLILLLLAWLVMIIMRLARPRFAFFWLIATLASLMAWLIILLFRLRLPFSFILIKWQAGEYLTASPVLMIDQFSWPFIMAFETICLGTVLTAVMRFPEHKNQDWFSWSTCMVINFCGLLCLLTGNIITLFLTWTLFALVELTVRLISADDTQPDSAIGVGIIRTVSIMILIGTVVVYQIDPGSIEIAPPGSMPANLFLLACGLWASSILWSRPKAHHLDQGVNFMLFFAPAGASLAMFTRLASSASQPSIPEFNGLALVVLSLAALLSAVKWITASDEQTGFTSWIIAGVLLSLLSSYIHQPASSLAWGLIVLLAGSTLFLLSIRNRLVNAIPILSMACIVAFPYSPAWQAVKIYSLKASPLTLIVQVTILLTHSLLITGYYRHALRTNEPPENLERWMWIIYPIGALLLPIALFFINYWNPLRQANPYFTNPSLSDSWPALVVTLIAICLIIIDHWQPGINTMIHTTRASTNLVKLPGRLARGLFQLAGNLATIFDQTLEGPGGILWALLLLTVLVTFLLQQFAGV